MRHLLLPALHLNRLGYTKKIGGSLPPVDLTDVLLNDFAATVVYPLTDIVSGAAIIAHGQSVGWNGTLSGWTLQDTPSPVYGNTDAAPFLDGADSGAFAGTSLASAIRWDKGSFFGIVKVSDPADWSDGAGRTIFRMQITGQYLIQIQKSVTANQLTYAYRVAAGTQATALVAASATNWFSVGMSWGDSANGNAVQPYLNGLPQTPAASTGTSATTGATLATFFCNATTPTNPWKGWACYFAFKLGAKWSDADFAAIENKWRNGV